jgi:hypothetical protein
MPIFARMLVAATLVAAVAGPAAATMGDFQSGGKKFKILSAQLGIKPAGAGCPTNVNVKGWVYMTHPTTIQVMLAKQGQGVVGGPYSITSVKASNGQYLATYSNHFVVNASVNTKYRLLVGGGSGTVSNWVPLKVTC